MAVVGDAVSLGEPVQNSGPARDKRPYIEADDGPMPSWMRGTPPTIVSGVIHFLLI